MIAFALLIFCGCYYAAKVRLISLICLYGVFKHDRFLAKFLLLFPLNCRRKLHCLCVVLQDLTEPDPVPDKKKKRRGSKSRSSSKGSKSSKKDKSSSSDSKSGD